MCINFYSNRNLCMYMCICIQIKGIYVYNVCVCVYNVCICMYNVCVCVHSVRICVYSYVMCISYNILGYGVYLDRFSVYHGQCDERS